MRSKKQTRKIYSSGGSQEGEREETNKVEMELQLHRAGTKASSQGVWAFTAFYTAHSNSRR